MQWALTLCQEVKRGPLSCRCPPDFDTSISSSTSFLQEKNYSHGFPLLPPPHHDQYHQGEKWEVSDICLPIGLRKVKEPIANMLMIIVMVNIIIIIFIAIKILLLLMVMIITKPNGLPHLPTIRPVGKGNNLANGNKEENWSACMRKKYIIGFWSDYAWF